MRCLNCPCARQRGGTAMQAEQIGINLAKISFQVHGVGRNNKIIFRKKLTRAQMLPFFANLPSYKSTALNDVRYPIAFRVELELIRRNA